MAKKVAMDLVDIFLKKNVSWKHENSIASNFHIYVESLLINFISYHSSMHSLAHRWRNLTRRPPSNCSKRANISTKLNFLITVSKKSWVSARITSTSARLNCRSFIGVKLPKVRSKNKLREINENSTVDKRFRTQFLNYFNKVLVRFLFSGSIFELQTTLFKFSVPIKILKCFPTKFSTLPTLLTSSILCHGAKH